MRPWTVTTETRTVPSERWRAKARGNDLSRFRRRGEPRRNGTPTTERGKPRRNMRRTLTTIALLLLALIAGLGAWGSTLPRDHAVRGQITLAVPPESVYNVMRDIGTLPAWWQDVEKVEAVTGTDGYERWKETSDGMAFTLIINTEEPPLRFTTRIDTTGSPGFGGTWSHEVALASGGGATVTITEEGWVTNPYFRVMMKLGGPYRTVDSYLTALGSRFGQTVTPTHLAP